MRKRGLGLDDKAQPSNVKAPQYKTEGLFQQDDLTLQISSSRRLSNQAGQGRVVLDDLV